MKKYIYFFLLSMIGSLHLSSSAKAAVQLSPWMLCYSCDVAPSVFDPYELVVLDSEHHMLATRLIDRGKVVLGYLSLGEVEKNRPWFSSIKSERLLLIENSNWPGSFFVDIRDARWVSRVIEELIPDMLQRGFQGVFLDTLDNPAELERRDGNKYKGMTDAAARLVITIRRHYPEIKIMMNRGYEILPKVGPYIDMELGESVFSHYDFKTKKYKLVDSKANKLQIKWLQAAANSFPQLKIYTLDYWNPEDKKGIAKIYKEERGNGFIPLVSTITLDRIVAEPTDVNLSK